MNEEYLRRVAVVMVLTSQEDAADDSLGISEMYPDLTDEEIQVVVDLIRRAKIEVSW